MTRSLGFTPITRASSLLRTGPPTEPATVLTPQQTPGLLPLAHCTQNQTGSIGSGLLTFRVGAADRARVASMPDTAWPINGHPPSSSRDKGHTPVLMPSISFDTSTANRLRSPSRSLPSASRALFPHRSPRSRHRSRSMWRFEASPRRATSKGQPSSPTQHHISKLRLHRTPLCVRDTHPHLTPHGRLFPHRSPRRSSVGWPEGVAPSGSHRSVREPLDSYGSCHLDHQTAGTAVVQAQCAKNRGYASATRRHACWTSRRPLNRRYFLQTQRIR